MPRSLDPTLEEKLASQSYDVYIRAHFYLEFTDTVPTFEMTTVTAYKLISGKTLQLEGIYTYGVDDFDQLGWVELERGVLISGTPNTISTARFEIEEGYVDGNYLKIKANLIPNKRIALSINGFPSFETLLATYFCPAIDAIFDNISDNVFQNHFSVEEPTDLVLNNAQGIEQILKQRAFMNFTENGYDSDDEKNNILFFVARPAPPTSFSTISTPKLVEIIINNPQTFNYGILSKDQSGIVHTPADTELPLYNIGYLRTVDTLPVNTGTDTANRIKRIPTTITPITLPMNLTYQNGDAVEIESLETGITASGYLQITEYLDLKRKEITWGIEISLWDYIGTNEGGSLNKNTQSLTPFAPLSSNAFDGNLDPSVNNLQALAEAVDDLTLGADTEEIQDIVGAMLSGNTETGITVTYQDEDGTIDFDAQTAGDARYAPIAKGVTNGDTHNHVGGDGAALKYFDVISANPHSDRVDASSTEFLLVYGTLFVASGSFPWPAAGTLKNMYIRTGGTQPASGSLVITLQVNGVDSALTITIAAGATFGTFSDTSNTVSISVGDLLRWKFVNNATGQSAQIAGISVSLEQSTT